MTSDAGLRPLRVAHAAVAPGRPLEDLPERLARGRFDMVELDVLANAAGRLVVAHDIGEAQAEDVRGFEATLRSITAIVGPDVRFDIDVKATGYEARVAAVVARLGITPRTLVSSMHVASLHALRNSAPELSLGLSVPPARHDYLSSRWTRPAARAALIYLRRTLPRRLGHILDAGVADAVMANWRVITPRLVAAARDRDAELFAWTVDDRDQLDRLLSLSVAGIITNDPGLFDEAPE